MYFCLIFRSDDSLKSTYDHLQTCIFFVGLIVGFFLYFVCNIGINTYRVKYMKRPICICTVETFLCTRPSRRDNVTIEMSERANSMVNECESSQQEEYHRDLPINKRSKTQKGEYYGGFQIYKLLCFGKNKESRKI